MLASHLGPARGAAVFRELRDGGDDEKDAALLNVFDASRSTSAFCSRSRARGGAGAKTRAERLKGSSGRAPQTERFAAMRRMRDFELRVLVSTDLTSRGVDPERVNLVAHMDAALTPPRWGRARRRFGANAMSVAL